MNITIFDCMAALAFAFWQQAESGWQHVSKISPRLILARRLCDVLELQAYCAA